MPHIYISEISSDNGLLSGLHHAIFLTNAGILLIWTLGKQTEKWRLFCSGRDELKFYFIPT